jgi:hypothetical protein
MASSKTQMTGGKMPDGFVSPFKRVQMEERNDDALACIATLTNKTLAEVTKLAVQLGYPPQGPAFVDNVLITKVLHNLGLTGGEYQDFTSLAAMPDVAILAVDFQSTTDVSRHLLWHHIRGTADQPAFSYIIDPANWIPEHQQITTDFAHLKLNPAWYIEITPRGGGKAKTV